MTPTYSNAPEPKYPDYYILDIDDIVTELLTDWHAAIAEEVAQYHDTPVNVYPEVYKIDPYSGAITKEVHVVTHHAVRQTPWHPDVSFIITHAIEAVKQQTDGSQDLGLAMQLLEQDLATMVHYQLAPNVPEQANNQAMSTVRLKIGKIASRFGRQLFKRMLDIGLYKNGYFPYHFCGWQDTCAIVQLDPFPVTHNMHAEMDAPNEELHLSLDLSPSYGPR